jgi:hypothetical protein
MLRSFKFLFHVLPLCIHSSAMASSFWWFFLPLTLLTLPLIQFFIKNVFEETNFMDLYNIEDVAFKVGK